MRKLLATMGIAAGLLAPAEASAQQLSAPIPAAQPVWTVPASPTLTPSTTARQVAPDIAGAVADSVAHGGSDWLAGGIAGAILVGGIWAVGVSQLGDGHPGAGKIVLGFVIGASIGFPIGALVGGNIPSGQPDSPSP